MALKEKRLETMRQITKPVEVKVSNYEPSVVEAVGGTEIYMLIDEDTGSALGAYSSEAKAIEAQEDMLTLYQVLTYVDVMVLDDELFGRVK